jgi:hypothetical protein
MGHFATLRFSLVALVALGAAPALADDISLNLSVPELCACG